MSSRFVRLCYKNGPSVSSGQDEHRGFRQTATGLALAMVAIGRRTIAPRLGIGPASAALNEQPKAEHDAENEDMVRYAPRVDVVGVDLQAGAMVQQAVEHIGCL